MRIQGTLDREGRVQVPPTFRLKTNHAQVWVEIPDQALEVEHIREPPAGALAGHDLSAEARRMLEELDAIRTRPLADGESASRYDIRPDREAAFGLREELRGGRGQS